MANVNATTLVALAVQHGVIENTKVAREAYASWLQRDPVAAQRSLVPHLRAAAASAPPPTDYPANWLPRSQRGKAAAAAARTGPRRVQAATIPANLSAGYDDRHYVASATAEAQVARHNAECARMLREQQARMAS